MHANALAVECIELLNQYVSRQKTMLYVDNIERVRFLNKIG